MGLRRLTQDVSLKLFSLGVAVLLFSFVSVENATPIDVDFPVEVRIGDDMMVVNDPPSVVHATLQGPWAAFRSFDAHELEAIVVDLTNAEPGTSRYAVTTSTLHPPGGMRALSVRSSELEITLDRRVERQVPVHADVAESPAFGYEVLDVRMAPARVRVVGPASKMQALEYVSTRAIDIAGRESELSLEVDLRPPPPPLRLLDKRVSVFVEIGEELTQRTLTGIPVEVLGAGAGATYAPQVVALSLKGPRRILEQMRPENLRVQVDVSHELDAGLERADKAIHLAQDLPDRTQLMSPVPRVVVQLGARRAKKKAP